MGNETERIGAEGVFDLENVADFVSISNTIKKIDTGATILALIERDGVRYVASMSANGKSAIMKIPES